MDLKLAITSSGSTLESAVDPRFGRCSYFLIVDSDSLDFEAVENPAITATGGAGVQAVQTVLDKGAEVIITGNVGPNAFKAMEAGDIELYIGTSGTVMSLINEFKEGKLQKVDSATVESHFGMGGSGKRGNRW